MACSTPAAAAARVIAPPPPTGGYFACSLPDADVVRTYPFQTRSAVRERDELGHGEDQGAPASEQWFGGVAAERACLGKETVVAVAAILPTAGGAY